VTTRPYLGTISDVERAEAIEVLRQLSQRSVRSKAPNRRDQPEQYEVHRALQEIVVKCPQRQPMKNDLLKVIQPFIDCFGWPGDDRDECLSRMLSAAIAVSGEEEYWRTALATNATATARFRTPGKDDYNSKLDSCIHALAGLLVRASEKDPLRSGSAGSTQLPGTSSSVDLGGVGDGVGVDDGATDDEMLKIDLVTDRARGRGDYSSVSFKETVGAEVATDIISGFTPGSLHEGDSATVIVGVCWTKPTSPFGKYALDCSVALDGDVWNWYLSLIRSKVDDVYIPDTSVVCVGAAEDLARFEKMLIRSTRMTSDIFVETICLLAARYLDRCYSSPERVAQLVADVLNNRTTEEYADSAPLCSAIYKNRRIFYIHFPESQIFGIDRDRPIEEWLGDNQRSGTAGTRTLAGLLPPAARHLAYPGVLKVYLDAPQYPEEIKSHFWEFFDLQNWELELGHAYARWVPGLGC
jgi:hypothetical protein